MNKLKKLATIGALAPLGALAEDETPIESAVGQLQTAATGAVDAVAPAVIAVCVALFVIVGVVFAYRMIKARLGR